jgi:hypothetical protein
VSYGLAEIYLEVEEQFEKLLVRVLGGHYNYGHNWHRDPIPSLLCIFYPIPGPNNPPADLGRAAVMEDLLDIPIVSVSVTFFLENLLPLPTSFDIEKVKRQLNRRCHESHGVEGFQDASKTQ